MNKRKMMRNKRAWIEIVEAFVAILLVAGVLLIIVNMNQPKATDFSERVYETQLSILREIQTNDSMRSEIALVSEPLPIEWEDANFPSSVKSKILSRTPTYLDCVGEICNIEEICALNNPPAKDVYSQAVTISATLEEGEVYRTLNIFCWIK